MSLGLACNLCVDCEGLSVDLDNSQPYLCMYDDHYAESLEDLSKECFKGEGI